MLYTINVMINVMFTVNFQQTCKENQCHGVVEDILFITNFDFENERYLHIQQYRMF